jgi:hypothetical protein
MRGGTIAAFRLRMFRRLDRSAESGRREVGDARSAGRSSLTASMAPRAVSTEAEDAVAGTNGLTGSLLPDGIRHRFEGSLGADLTGVRIHTGPASAAAADAVGAKAYASGQDIHFAAGKYQPDDPFGMHLLAHEVAHTVQQSGASAAAPQCKLEVSMSGDASEVEADRAADAMVRGERAAVSSASAGQIQRDPNGAEPAEDILQRAVVARDANDLEQMKAVNARARELRAKSFADPPKGASDALHTIRTHLMEKVAALIDTMNETKRANSATVDAARTEDQTAAVEAAEATLDRDATPYLDALLTGDPQYRYYHMDRPDVQTKVAQALRIHSAHRGLAQIGHRADAEDEARTTGKLPDGSWCGAFAYTQQAKAAGMDPYWRDASLGTGGIMAALTYGWGNNPWIWAEGDWHKLKDYHAHRGSPRHYQTVGTTPPADIQAGDIVLIDNARGMDPDHIQIAVAFDGRYLAVMGGNQGSELKTDETGVSRSNTIDITQNKTSNDVRQVDGAGNRIPGTSDPKLKKNVRLHGVGRWSLVDFEQHIFNTSAKKPAPPSEKELGNVMR